METREILKGLREKHHMTQDQMAERVMVTRQAVSRWETGETQPNTETLRILSREFGVSINTKSRMAASMRITVNGAIRTGSMLISRRKLCWIFWSTIPRTRKTHPQKTGESSLTDIYPN